MQAGQQPSFTTSSGPWHQPHAGRMAGEGGARRETPRSAGRRNRRSSLAWGRQGSCELALIVAKRTRCFYCVCLALSKDFNLASPWQRSRAVGTIIIPILQRRKVGHGEALWLARGLWASKCRARMGTRAAGSVICSVHGRRKKTHAILRMEITTPGQCGSVVGGRPTNWEVWRSP